MTVSRCECGKRKSRDATHCRDCHKRILEEHYAEARKIVESGKCPQCGSGLRRNTSMTGWWQCRQYGAEQFRERLSEPPCSFQTFTS